jgi:hypothetical protein
MPQSSRPSGLRSSLRSVLVILSLVLLAGGFGAGVALYPPLLRMGEIALVVVVVVSAAFVYLRRRRELD